MSICKFITTLLMKKCQLIKVVLALLKANFTSDQYVMRGNTMYYYL